MFFRKLKEQKKINTKLRARISNLINEKAIDKQIYQDKLYEVSRDKNIQEENNIKLLGENMMYKKAINRLNEAIKIKDEAIKDKEIEKILADLRVQLISLNKK